MRAKNSENYSVMKKKKTIGQVEQEWESIKEQVILVQITYNPFN